MVGLAAALVLSVGVLCGAGAWSAEPVLASATCRIVLSPATGQVLSLTDGGGTVWLAANEDLYDLGGKLSTEAADRVLEQRRDGDRIVFECRNEELGLTLAKSYRIAGDTVAKEVAYTGPAGEGVLLRVSSRSQFEPALYAQGYYYTAIDDGYKVRAVPFLPAADVTVASPWTISTGQLVLYVPHVERLLAHYRYRVNGGHCLGEAEGVRSEYVPGGAVTALGQGFVSQRGQLTLESRFALLAGDPRAFHRHLVGQAPYAEHRGGPVPAWFRRARLYMGDGHLATGRGLIEDTDSVARDVRSFLTQVPGDDCLMVFFNHWSTSGDYPYQGTLRYFLYQPAQWSDPVPAAKVRDAIRAIKAISPRTKVGGYFYFAPAAGTVPYEQHRDWFVHDEQGHLVPGSDGVGLTGLPDFSTPYREYVLDQLRHAVTDLGFDWLHLDTTVGETVNYRTRHVAQSWEMARFYEELSAFCTAHDAAIVQNVAWTTALWAHGGYLECQQPERWERRDWRILGVSGFANALYRSQRPGTWVNLVYGCAGAYGTRNAFTGMRGWIRNAMTWWNYAAMSLAREEVVDQLLELPPSEVVVHPDWWRLETDALEAQPLQAGGALVIPVILHGDQPRTEEISLDSSRLPLARKGRVFSLDLRLAPPDPVDLFRPVPWRAEFVKTTGFQVHDRLPDTYRHSLELVPQGNVCHVLTSAPAWVYAANGRRTALLLPETCGVRVRGVLPVGAKRYELETESLRGGAQVLAFMPPEWRRAAVKSAGAAVPASLVDVLGQRCLLFEVGQGSQRLEIAESAPGGAEPPRQAYANPDWPVWECAAERVLYAGLSHRAYTEAGRSCLELSGTGTARFPIAGGCDAGGFALWLEGTGTGGTLRVLQQAGEAWAFEVRDDFAGWREFAVRREQMTPVGSGRRWETTTGLTLEVRPAPGQSLHLADIHLLPAQPGDLPAKGPDTRRAIALRTPVPPVLDGNADQPCWQKALPLSKFYGLGRAQADSQTEVRACYDAEALYVRFENRESIESLGSVQKRDTAIWNTNHVELYLDPFRDGTQYYHLLCDPAGTIEDLRSTRTGRTHEWDGEFALRTYLNWKAGWVAEFRIPFGTVGRAPAEGEVWGFNLARKDISGEWSNWGTLKEWLDPANFGELEFAGETAPPPEARPTAPATAALPPPAGPPAEPELLFHARFDGSLVPEVRTGPADFTAPADPQFVAGRSGQALVVRHTFGVRYPVAGNLELEQGTISLWVKPLNWNRNQQLFHHFVWVQSDPAGLPAEARPFSVLLYRFWEWDQVLAYGMQQWLTGEGFLALPMDEGWVPDRWHHLAFTWNDRELGLFVDGDGVTRPFREGPPTVLSAKEIQVGGPYFRENDGLTAIDDLRIYSRSLTAAEIQRLGRE